MIISEEFPSKKLLFKLPEVEEAIICMTNILEKICGSTGIALFMLAALELDFCGLLFFFPLSSDVPKFAAYSGSVTFILMPGRALAACISLSSQCRWSTDVANKIKLTESLFVVLPIERSLSEIFLIPILLDYGCLSYYALLYCFLKIVVLLKTGKNCNSTWMCGIHGAWTHPPTFLQNNWTGMRSFQMLE